MGAGRHEDLPSQTGALESSGGPAKESLGKGPRLAQGT